MIKNILLIFICAFVYNINAQTTYVPDNNFEQRLIDLGLDDVLDDYVLTANISGVTSLDIQYQSIADATGLQDFASLTVFNCDNNQIPSLNFHPNANLNFFICQNNPLTQLDLSQHTSLFEFSCTNTYITVLDLSQNTNLRYLYCRSTPLIDLDLSNNPNLLEISAADSNFEFVDLRSGNNEEIGVINFLNNPNLPYMYVDDCNYSTANWNQIDPTTIFVEMEGQTECEPLGINEYLSTSEITLYPNPASDELLIKRHISKPANAILYDITGKSISSLLLNKLENKIDVSNITSGIYFIIIYNFENSVVKKIVIE